VPQVALSGPPARDSPSQAVAPDSRFHHEIDIGHAPGRGAAPTNATVASGSEFRPKKYLVTVGRDRKFVVAWAGGLGCTPPIGSGKHTHLNGGRGLADSGASGAYDIGLTESDHDNLAPTNDNLACQTDGATRTDSPGGMRKLG
jgi:hypothetical protein